MLIWPGEGIAGSARVTGEGRTPEQEKAIRPECGDMVRRSLQIANLRGTCGGHTP
jgi:hypothetical protein